MLQSMIGKIGIFMICAQTILYFRPKEVYGKYLRLLFSVMILIQIVQPFTNFFLGGNGIDLQGSMQQFQRSLDESMEQAVEKAVSSEEKLQQMSLEEVQERLEEAEEVEKASENENGDENGNGEGNGVTLEESEKVEIAPITTIEEIRLDGEEADE